MLQAGSPDLERKSQGGGVMPEVTLETVKAWMSAGLQVKLIRVKGGYIVKVGGPA